MHRHDKKAVVETLPMPLVTLYPSIGGVWVVVSGLRAFDESAQAFDECVRPGAASEPVHRNI
eukprot:290900-Amphidinium_carterae.1